MRKITLFYAISLDGCLAKIDGELNWLDTINSPESEYKKQEFFKTIDTTILGFNSYKEIKRLGITKPFSEKKNFVVTSHNESDTEHFSFVTADHIKTIKALKESDGGDIWVLAGPELSKSLLDAKLVDTIEIFMLSSFLYSGLDLFDEVINGYTLNLLAKKGFSNGAHQMSYGIKY